MTTPREKADRFWDKLFSHGKSSITRWPWRQKVEQVLGSEGLASLRELHAKYRQIDRHQIIKVFPQVGAIPPLVGVLDTLNWLSLEITKPEGPVYVATEGKLQELQHHLSRLKQTGYFIDQEPERFKFLRETLGAERAKEVFEP